MPLTRSELNKLATERQVEKESRLKKEAKSKAKKIKQMTKHLIAICHKRMKSCAKVGEFYLTNTLRGKSTPSTVDVTKSIRILSSLT